MTKKRYCKLMMSMGTQRNDLTLYLNCIKRNKMTYDNAWQICKEAFRRTRETQKEEKK